MEINAGKAYNYSGFIRTTKSTNLFVRIRWQDNSTSRYKL
jgi:hypothetical protein